jgi:hypothetical protein
MAAPSGRHWPAEADQILEPGWMDSTEAMRIALEAAREKCPELAAGDLQVLTLASASKGLKTGISLSPPRDGMFDMEAWWSASFAGSGPTGRRSVFVRVPAYGGRPTVEIHEAPGAKTPAQAPDP